VKAAAVFDADMTAEQAEQLAALMEQGVATRPSEVALATLHVDGSHVRLVAYWNSRQALEDYRATSPVLRGTALMREVGVEPSVTIVDVPAFG
jgi:hypothetical protein